MLHAEIRQWWLEKAMVPIESRLIQWGFHPNAITIAAFVLCFPCMFLFVYGHFLWAGFLTLFIGSLDILDGRVARQTNRVSKHGEFLDSVLDRYQDFMLLSGVCYYFKNHWLFAFCLAAVGGSFFVSYVRSKASVIGVDVGRVGVMQRPERFFLLGFGSLISGIFHISMMPFDGTRHNPPHVVLMGVLIVLALSTNLSAFARIKYVWFALESEKK